jgi:bacteriochlorophyll 4-vinyl reductase
MVDAGIGRLLIASLHEGIADIAPMRLEFYENWLTPPGLREGKFGLAPLHAVLSFLRLEGQPTYESIMTRAGQHTADWAYAELSSVERALVRSFPMGLRARWALRLSKRLVAQTFKGSKASTRLKKRSGTLGIRASVFCSVREKAGWPMCVFYSAAVERFLQRFDLDAHVQIAECRAFGGVGCTMLALDRFAGARHRAGPGISAPAGCRATTFRRACARNDCDAVRESAHRTAALLAWRRLGRAPGGLL